VSSKPILLSSSPALFCQIRRQWVVASPEEQVRQRLLCTLVEILGFPIELIAVEKAIRQLPHLAEVDPRQIPNRRVDIVCYSPQGNSLEPLLVIECKAVPLTWKVINQVLGYQILVRSRYVAIANETQVQVGQRDPRTGEWLFSDALPSYQALTSS